mmetsp:Transcript_53127/g.142044  ORF Transcript_53127/g.142044 Transcript_53127/m.142044 type:complete len:224 (+) Transcript_53127:160-831(+)
MQGRLLAHSSENKKRLDRTPIDARSDSLVFFFLLLFFLFLAVVLSRLVFFFFLLSGILSVLVLVVLLFLVFVKLQSGAGTGVICTSRFHCHVFFENLLVQVKRENAMFNTKLDRDAALFIFLVQRLIKTTRGICNRRCQVLLSLLEKLPLVHRHIRSLRSLGLASCTLLLLHLLLFFVLLRLVMILTLLLLFGRLLLLLLFLLFLLVLRLTLVRCSLLRSCRV